MCIYIYIYIYTHYILYMDIHACCDKPIITDKLPYDII